MKKTYCSSSDKNNEDVFVCGNLFTNDKGRSVYLVTDEKTAICVHAETLGYVGFQHSIDTFDRDRCIIFHGSVTMEN